MSFSSDIKECLCNIEYECPDCRVAELAGFFRFTGKLSKEPVKAFVSNDLMKKRISEEVMLETGDYPQYAGERIVLGSDQTVILRDKTYNVNLKKTCCKTSFIRGAFLGGGSVSNPEKEYHMEFGTNDETEADGLIELLAKYDVRARKTHRRGKTIVYMKDSSNIADTVAYITDGNIGLEILFVQVEKELKSSTQRIVNCDSANLNKQALASSRHIVAIKRIKAAKKWSAMPEVLREIGELRMKYPDVSLEELGKMTKQRIGKSGVNHRLNRIMEFAAGLKEGEEAAK